jgi:phospholipid/cholesterol/gamma-HCH transport system substrate-binding protein
MLDRLTRLQLSIFAVVTVLTVGAISIFYLHVPAAMGIGSYNVDANFVAGGGLYQNANVTYRGVTVGRVESVGLTNDGVVANMRLNSGTPVPENVTASSTSTWCRRTTHRTRRCATGRPSTKRTPGSARTSRGC